MTRSLREVSSGEESIIYFKVINIMLVMECECSLSLAYTINISYHHFLTLE